MKDGGVIITAGKALDGIPAGMDCNRSKRDGLLIICCASGDNSEAVSGKNSVIRAYTLIYEEYGLLLESLHMTTWH